MQKTSLRFGSAECNPPHSHSHTHAHAHTFFFLSLGGIGACNRKGHPSHAFCACVCALARPVSMRGCKHLCLMCVQRSKTKASEKSCGCSACISSWAFAPPHLARQHLLIIHLYILDGAATSSLPLSPTLPISPVTTTLVVSTSTHTSSLSTHSHTIRHVCCS